MGQLKLIVNKKAISMQHVAAPRPYGTFYYRYLADKKDHFYRRGHAATITGALKAGMAAMRKDKTAKMIVVDEDGQICCVMVRHRSVIRINGA